jgi:hypothetical protein
MKMKPTLIQFSTVSSGGLRNFTQAWFFCSKVPLKVRWLALFRASKIQIRTAMADLIRSTNRQA